MKVKELKSFADKRGMLYELFRHNVDDVAMAYIVTLNAREGRDWKQWHIHHCKTETFICVSGSVKLAVEKDGVVTVFMLSGSYPQAVAVSPREGHSVVNPGIHEAAILVLCDNYYDEEDERRIPMKDWTWD